MAGRHVEDLEEAGLALAALSAPTAESSHGATKSLTPTIPTATSSR
jgi:hypothetical protein